LQENGERKCKAMELNHKAQFVRMTSHDTEGRELVLYIREVLGLVLFLLSKSLLFIFLNVSKQKLRRFLKMCHDFLLPSSSL
jgi:hypothetical protein